MSLPGQIRVCYQSSMSLRTNCVLTACLSTCALLAAVTEPFSVVPSEQREALSKRLGGYVEAYKGRKWEKLYGFVSDVGKGGATQQFFTAAMKSNHGTDFAQMPDLQEFKPGRTEKNENGFDIYGCGKAQREGMRFNGIAVVHAVYEHEDWFFTGWQFTDFPNEPCKTLSDPKWQPDSRLWNSPMDEIANLKQRGVPVHIDQPH
jgi:hypothetical protein